MALGLLEKRSIGVCRGKIPHRILICGVRGKTTLARMLHAGFLASSHRTTCRISGDSPVYIDANGTPEAVRRWGPANIREVRRALHRMAKDDTEIAVLENMAIQYDLQKVICHEIVRPTMVIVAPDAPDHLEHWPLDPALRASSLLETIPHDVPVVFVPTPANRMAHDLALEQGRNVHWPEVPPAVDLPDWSAALAAATLHTLHAIGVGEHAPQATREVIDLAKNSSKPSLWKVNGRDVLDLMSANDPETSTTLVEEAIRSVGHDRVHLVYNHRADRPARLASFLPLFQRWPASLMGDMVPLSCSGIFPGHLGRRAAGVIRQFSAGDDGETLYILLGNANGEGATMRTLLAEIGERITW
ncbi:MAG: hypothetical protein JJU11_11835 [Candidatus Sumerlaeia bacterium]|nr:hypothetical protein [Candidatus Sumerlaeia bacterium]